MGSANSAGDGRTGREQEYKKDSLSLIGSVAMGTGVMIGAGIFALTGQVAQLAGGVFPLAFIAAAVVVLFSAYSYARVTRKYPSSGGIAMILTKAYGEGALAAGCALLMYFSMVINESLVARTFGTYTMRIFGRGSDSKLVPLLGVGLVAAAFVINLLGNDIIGGVSKATSLLKIIGIALLAGVGLIVSGFSLDSFSSGSPSGTQGTAAGFIAAVALAVLAYKGFTTITNSGAEIVNPKKNIGRSIWISISICTALYLLVTLSVAMSLSIKEIVGSRDSSLAEAARPALGRWGEWLTIAIAILASISGIVASIFAVSRMLAMLTDMGLVPHRRLGMGGRIQTRTLVYTVVIATALTVLFDLSRIASLGAIFYIVMDIAIHWGVYKHLRRDVGARPSILLTAIALDAIALGGFVYVKAGSDPIVLGVAALGFILIFGGEARFLSAKRRGDDPSDDPKNDRRQMS